MPKDEKGVNPDMSTEEILEKAPEEAEPLEEESTSKQPSETTEKVEKTPEEKESPIPYSRFKEVNEEKNQFKTEKEKLEAELEEQQGILDDPEVLRLVRRKQGFSEEAINKELGEPAPEIKGEFDLTKPEGWKEFIQAEIQKGIQPIKENLNQTQKQSREKEVQDWIAEQETQAKELSEKLGIPYGEDSKSESDPKTAVGKISAYLNKNPKDAQLGHVRLLKLALADEGFSFGEAKGVAKEKKRQEKLKTAAMEGGAESTSEEYPQADWSSERIGDWLEKHPEESI